MSTKSETETKKPPVPVVPKAVPEDEDQLFEFLVQQRKSGKTLRAISEDTGIPLTSLSRKLKGIELEEKPEADAPKDKERPMQYIQIAIPKEAAAKLYALAIDEGYSGVEEFLEVSMMPWYKMKRHFEWVMRMKIVPDKFQKYIETCMADSMELQHFKEQFSKQLSDKKELACMPGNQ